MTFHTFYYHLHCRWHIFINHICRVFSISQFISSTSTCFDYSVLPKKMIRKMFARGIDSPRLLLLLLLIASCILTKGWMKLPIKSRITRTCTLEMMSTPQFNRDRKPQAPPPPINQYIKADKVRLIAPGNETGEDIMLGIYSLADALKEAEKYEVDLVMINDKGDPPVCKIIDYGKYKYAMEKKKKENMKKQVNVDIKEVKMTYKIDQHDFDVRMRAVRKFLGEGDKVKVVVQFKGREMQHKELGRDLLQKIFTPIEDIASMESTPKVEGRAMTMLVGPKKTI